MNGRVDYAGARSSGGYSAGVRFGAVGFSASMARIPWGFAALIAGIAVFGVMVLYSSTITNPSEAELPYRHAVRFALAFFIMIGLALTPLRIWARAALPAYLATLILLVAVEIFGSSGGGAQRWLQVGPIRLQPSELMKLALVLAMARYYHNVLTDVSGGTLIHVPALLMLLAPAVFILAQPDLGTTLMLFAAGGAIIFFAGLRWRLIGGVVAAQLISMPIVHYAVLDETQRAQPASWMGVGSVVYFFGMKDYQRARVDSLFDPGSDPLGAGYQAEQAKIAIGSGGWEGRGFTQGVQSQLDYIPEQHTDFIFTVVAEEFGFLGAAGLLLAWGVVLVWSVLIALRCRNQFGRFAAVGAAATIAFYVAFNVGMVMGLLPVVGVPLPLISYGGSVMITVMAAFGLILSADVHREERIDASSWI